MLRGTEQSTCRSPPVSSEQLGYYCTNTSLIKVLIVAACQRQALVHEQIIARICARSPCANKTALRRWQAVTRQRTTASHGLQSSWHALHRVVRDFVCSRVHSEVGAAVIPLRECRKVLRYTTTKLHTCFRPRRPVTQAVAILRRGLGGPDPPSLLAGHLLGPPSFLLNFMLKFVWLTYTADNVQQAKLWIII